MVAKWLHKTNAYVYQKHTIAPSFKRMYVALCFFMFLSYLTQFSNPTVTAQNYKTQVVNLGSISILYTCIHVLFKQFNYLIMNQKAKALHYDTCNEWYNFYIICF